jgi:polyhydroxyalkanoate synthesis regulator phasin
MVKPIPDNVKDCLSELSPAQQVTLRTYMGTLRAEIKDLEENIRTLEDPDPDPHAHYHGHEK